MNRPRAGLGHDGRIVLTAWLAGFPGVALSLILLWTGDYSLKLQATLTLVVVIACVGFLGSLRGQVVRPLQTIANLVAAAREGDFSVRGRRQGAGVTLGTAMMEINALGLMLREQRLAAIEANTLLGKVMFEIDVAIFAFDDGDRLRLCNRAGELLLQRPAERLLGEGAAALGLWELLTGEPQRTLEASFPGGRRVWQLRRTAFRQRGRPHQLVVLADVQRALRDEERQAWQRLVRVLGHEINNSLTPISSIAGNLRQTLRRPPLPADWDDDLARGLAVIERRAEGLGRFMTSYARLARLPSPTLAPLELGPWLARCPALDRRVPITVTPGPPLAVPGDQDQLEQLLINLLRNAVDAALETGGAVGVTWRRSGALAELIVSDEGPGLADTANLFVPFFTTKPNGSGIGLVLSRQIAEAHRGSVELANRTDRPGCQATVRLPL